MSLVAIDLSLRSAGLVALDGEGRLLGQLLVASHAAESDDEQLLLKVEAEVFDFITRNTPTAVVFEGLAFGAKSSRGDLIAGNFWNLKKELAERFPDVPVGSIPVTAWRKHLLCDKKARDRAALLWSKYDKKMAAYCRLPLEVKQAFADYLRGFDFPPQWDRVKKRDAIFDLADAYFLGRYRLTLGSIHP
jgi:hypothetical protein